MIILDTNVVSEPLKPQPTKTVIAWLDAQIPDTLYLTTINLAELLAGINTLPIGRRRRELEQAINHQVLPLFKGRILTFNQPAAEAFAGIFAKTRAVGPLHQLRRCRYSGYRTGSRLPGSHPQCA